MEDEPDDSKTRVAIPRETQAAAEQLERSLYEVEGILEEVWLLIPDAGDIPVAGVTALADALSRSAKAIHAHQCGLAETARQGRAERQRQAAALARAKKAADGSKVEPSPTAPFYCRQKGRFGYSDLAFVTLPNGASRPKRIYLGVHGSEESKREYEAIIAAWRAGKAVEQIVAEQKKRRPPAVPANVSQSVPAAAAVPPDASQVHGTLTAILGYDLAAPVAADPAPVA